jgi:hypothetical protein
MYAPSKGCVVFIDATNSVAALAGNGPSQQFVFTVAVPRNAWSLPLELIMGSMVSMVSMLSKQNKPHVKALTNKLKNILFCFYHWIYKKDMAISPDDARTLSVSLFRAIETLERADTQLYFMRFS